MVVNAKNAPQGEIYAKWKRNTNRKVGREGDEEEARGGGAGASTGGGGGWGSGGGRGRRGGWGDTGGGAWGGEEPAGGKGGKEQGGRVVRDELKTKAQIRKNKKKVRQGWRCESGSFTRCPLIFLGGGGVFLRLA